VARTLFFTLLAPISGQGLSLPNYCRAFSFPLVASTPQEVSPRMRDNTPPALLRGVQVCMPPFTYTTFPHPPYPRPGPIISPHLPPPLFPLTITRSFQLPSFVHILPQPSPLISSHCLSPIRPPLLTPPFYQPTQSFSSFRPPSPDLSSLVRCHAASLPLPAHPAHLHFLNLLFCEPPPPLHPHPLIYP